MKTHEDVPRLTGPMATSMKVLISTSALESVALAPPHAAPDPTSPTSTELPDDTLSRSHVIATSSSVVSSGSSQDGRATGRIENPTTVAGSTSVTIQGKPALTTMISPSIPSATELISPYNNQVAHSTGPTGGQAKLDVELLKYQPQTLASSAPVIEGSISYTDIIEPPTGSKTTFSARLATTILGSSISIDSPSASMESGTFTGVILIAAPPYNTASKVLTVTPTKFSSSETAATHGEVLAVSGMSMSLVPSSIADESGGAGTIIPFPMPTNQPTYTTFEIYRSEDVVDRIMAAAVSEVIPGTISSLVSSDVSISVATTLNTSTTTSKHTPADQPPTNNLTSSISFASDKPSTAVVNGNDTPTALDPSSRTVSSSTTLGVAPTAISSSTSSSHSVPSNTVNGAAATIYSLEVNNLSRDFFRMLGGFKRRKDFSLIMALVAGLLSGTAHSALPP